MSPRIKVAPSVAALNADRFDGLDSLQFLRSDTADTMEGTLTFSGITTDITTASNEHLALIPAGTGNVGIGTTSPQALLQAGTAAGSGLFVTGAGNVGIGFSSPTGRLDVRGDEVRIWTGAGTDTNAVSGGELYVEGDLEVDATAYMDGPLVIATSGLTTTGNINTTKTSGNNFFMSNVGIGNSSPGQRLDITGGNGRVESGYSWLTTSDIRFKKNITTLKASLNKVMGIRGVRYDLIAAKDIKVGEGRHIGFVAQELEKEFPELVVTDEKGGKAVSYDKMTAVLVEAIKEQQRQIASLRSEVSQLKAQFQPSQ